MNVQHASASTFLVLVTMFSWGSIMHYNSNSRDGKNEEVHYLQSVSEGMMTLKHIPHPSHNVSRVAKQPWIGEKYDFAMTQTFFFIMTCDNMLKNVFVQVLAYPASTNKGGLYFLVI